MNSTLQLFRICILLLLPLCISVGAQECATVDSAHTDETISFLRKATSNPDVSEACVVTAIRKLQYAHSKEAIEVLIQYLDFKRHTRSQAVVTGSNSEVYPAISSLFAIGKPALPFLVSVAGGSAFEKVAQENAVRTIMMIYRDDPPAGIKYLLTEAERSQDAGQRGLLRDAMRFGLRWCQGERSKECESLVNAE